MASEDLGTNLIRKLVTSLVRLLAEPRDSGKRLEQIAMRNFDLNRVNIDPLAKMDPTVHIVAAKGQLSIAPDAQVHRHVTLDCSTGVIKIGRRSVIFPNAMIMAYPNGSVEIGDDCTINPFSILYGHGGLIIGNHVRIAAHTVIIPANHIFVNLDRPIASQGLSKEGIVINDDVWIGANVTILDGVTLGEGCVVGAGAVVTQSFPSHSIIVGNPAKLIKDRNAR